MTTTKTMEETNDITSMMTTTTTTSIIAKVSRMKLILCIYSFVLTILYLYQQNDTTNPKSIASLLQRSVSTTTMTTTSTTLTLHNSSINDNNNNKNNNGGIYAVVHIGPPKTGSSTIQYMMNQLRKELEADHYEMPNYYIPGKNKNNTNMKELAACLREYKNINYEVKTSLYCDANIVLHIIYIASRRRHLLLSAEALAFAIVKPEILYTSLSPYHNHNINNNEQQSNNNQIKIVIYYRRFYEWLLSLNNQNNKLKLVWERQSIYDWIKDESKINILLNGQYSSSSYKRYSQYFNNIQIINMHELNHNLVENFFCDALINANHTCNKVRNSSNSMLLSSNNNNNDTVINDVEEQRNKYRPLVYDDLLYMAIQMNVIPSKYDLDEYRNQLKIYRNEIENNNRSTIQVPDNMEEDKSDPILRQQHYHQQQSQDDDKNNKVVVTNHNNNNRGRNILEEKKIYKKNMFQFLSLKVRQYQEEILLLNEYNFTKWICPNEQNLNRILQISLEVEESLLPEFYKSGNQKEIITNDFHRMKDINKFCIVDVKYILSNNINGWNTFFKSF